MSQRLDNLAEAPPGDAYVHYILDGINMSNNLQPKQDISVDLRKFSSRQCPRRHTKQGSLSDARIIYPKREVEEQGGEKETGRGVSHGQIEARRVEYTHSH